MKITLGKQHLLQFYSNLCKHDPKTLFRNAVKHPEATGNAINRKR